jgi:hypothetical protein
MCRACTAAPEASEHPHHSVITPHGCVRSESTAPLLEGEQVRANEPVASCRQNYWHCKIARIQPLRLVALGQVPVNIIDRSIGERVEDGRGPEVRPTRQPRPCEVPPKVRTVLSPFVYKTREEGAV